MSQEALAQKVQGLDALIRMQFDQPAQKRTLKYGHRIAKEMWSYITDNNVGYYGERYRQWKLNENWMKGILNEQEFWSYMGVEGNKTWLNMDYGVIKVLPRYVKSIINRFMEREEKPDVKTTDALSQKYKEREKLLAKVRMQNADKIRTMEKVSGMQLSGGYIPENEDDLDIYYKIKWRLPEEVWMEKAVWKVFQNSDYEFLKETTLRDGIKTNLMVHKLKELPYTPGRSPAERLRIHRCDPKNTVYNIFKHANGSDITIIGEAFAYKISEARRAYPHISEKDWFKLAQIAQKGLVQAEPLNWTDSYVYSFNRPYDDYSFIAFDFEARTYDPEYYVKQKDKNGDDMIVFKKSMPTDLGPDKQLLESGRYNVYGGLYVPVGDIMMDWRVLPNQIRPYQNGVDCFSSYSVAYPDADGFYVPALIERGIPPVRQLVLTALKIQQMLALMEPENLDIDVSGLHGLDIGTGAKLKPIDVLKIKKQTGIGWYDSTDESGVDGNPERRSPFQNRQYSGNVAQLNVLIGLYNFWIQRLNDELGENDETMGRPTAAKKSAAASKIAAAAGGGSTEFIYDAYIQLVEQDATKIVYRIWDMLVLEAGGYKSLEGIERDMIDTTFDVNINMLDKTARKERLQLRIQNMLTAGVITASIAERLDNIEDPKDALLYLEYVEKQMAKKAQQKQEREIQLNAQVQQQSTQIATQGKIQMETAKAQAKALVEHLKSNDEAFRDLFKMISDAEKEAARTGGQLPADLSMLKEYMTTSILQKQQQADQPQEQDQQPEMQ